MKNSRRSRRLEKKTKRNIVLTIIGIIAIFVFLVKFGIPMMANVAIFVSGFKTVNEAKTDNNSFIQPPILDSIPSATNSAQIIISGKAIKGCTVGFYIDDMLVNSDAADDKGNFSFTETLNLGDNQIKARIEVDGKKSDFSDTVTITYKNTDPSITIDTPADGEEFKKDNKEAAVSGSTDSGTTVTVNGFWAIVDENNNYSYNLPLKNGDNEITVVAADQAGNKSEKTIKVKYSD